jgi:uncharacterized membrane protein
MSAGVARARLISIPEVRKMSSISSSLPLPGWSPWKVVGWVLLLLGALVAAANAFWFTLGDGALNVDGLHDSVQRARMFEIAVIGYAHTLGGAIAALIGPFQFLGSMRARYPRLHVWLGRIYLTCVGVSALGGLYLSPNSEARNTLGIAFIALAIAWLYTGTKAYLTIRARDVEAHRRWMIRNYALTYAAVTLRFQMPLLIGVFGFSPMMALNIDGWLCWVPNLILAELWIRRGRSRAVPASTGFARARS